MAGGPIWRLWISFRSLYRRVPRAVRMLAALGAVVAGATLLFLTSSGATPLEMTPQITNMVEWLRQKGGEVHPCIDIAKCRSGGGRCVMSRCPIAASTLLVAVPRDAQLRGLPPGAVEANDTAGMCPRLSAWAALPNSQGGAADWHLDIPTMHLVLRLLEERRRALTSKWAVYLPTIPEDFPSILWEEESQKRCLGGTPSEVHIARRFERRTAEHRLLHRCKIQHTLEWADVVGDVQLGTKIDRELGAAERDEVTLRWALHAVGSRSYEAPSREGGANARPDPAMVPFADLFNDSPEPNAKWHFRDEGAKAGTFEIVAGPEGIEAGIEVSLSYGKKTSDQLLTHYGFAHPENPLDMAYLDLIEGSPLSPHGQDARLSLSFDVDTTAGWLPRTLTALRNHFAQDAKSADEKEKLVLGLLQKRCSEAKRAWEGEGTAPARPKFKGTPKLWSDDGGPSCRVYKGGLAALAGACVEFAVRATAEVASTEAPTAAAIASSPGKAMQLSARLLAAWRADRARVAAKHK